MKKIISYLLVAMMCLSCLAACGEQPAKEKTDLELAADYVYAMYKDAGTVTAKDFERTAQVMIGTTAYAVEWTTNNEAIKVTVADKVATIDVDEKSPEAVEYVLTATIKDADGNVVTKEFKYTVPKYEGLEKIVKDAYALQPGETLEGTFTLEGVIKTVDTPYDAGYKNVTVTIQVGDLKDMPIMCYRLKGEGADTIKAGDTITVTGTLTNYNGTIEFNAGCTLDKVVVGEDATPALPEIPANATMEQLVDISYQLVSGQKFDTPFTLKGVITAVNTAFDASYGNVTVTIQVGDKADKLIECYRMKGEGADTIKVGDTITVTGYMKNYSGKIEFDAGCTLDKVEAAQGGSTTEPEKPADPKPEDPKPENPKPETPANPTTPAEIMAATEKLADGEYLGGSKESVYKLSGVVTKIEGTWNSKYGNMPVTIKVDGTDGKTIYCYGVTCDENDQFKVGEKITVEGCIKNYGGLIEFWCPTLISRDHGGSDPETPSNPDTPANPTTQKEIVDAAYALASGATLEGGPYTLTGTINNIKTAPQDSTYTPGSWEACLTISVEGKDFYCFWLKGTEAQMKDLKLGDTITVSGTIKNYNGTIEFDKPQMQ